MTLATIDPGAILAEYNWKDCNAVFVCENGEWKCTSAQFYQSSECGFMPEEPPAGHTGNPLEGYVAPEAVMIEQNKVEVQEAIAEITPQKGSDRVLADAGVGTELVSLIAIVGMILITALLWLKRHQENR